MDKMQNLSMMKGVLSSILHFAILTREKADVSKSDENSLNRKDGGKQSSDVIFTFLMFYNLDTKQVLFIYYSLQQ